MSRPRITVVGNINMDAVVRTPRFPLEGETLVGHGVSWSPGGKAANQAVAAARLGAEVSLVGCVGDDSLGETLLAGLVAEGVDCAGVHRTGRAPTGMAFVMVRDDGQNAIVSCLGANLCVGPEDVQEARNALADADVVLVQLGIPLDAVEAALDLCNEVGTACFLDLSPIRAGPPSNWRKAAVVSPNETEAAVILGETGSPLSEPPEQTAARLLQAGARRVALKLGAGGCLVADGKGMLHTPALSVTVVDTTGAGDAFLAGLAVGIVEQQHWGLAARLATVAGSLACTRGGAQPSLPARPEVQSHLQELSLVRGA